MEIEQNTPETYRKQILTALQVGDVNLLKALRKSNIARFVSISTLTDLKEYRESPGDYVLFSEPVKEHLENNWIVSVLNGYPISPKFGYIPSMDAREVIRIYDKILLRIT